MYGFMPAGARGALTLEAAALWLAAVPAQAGPASGGSVMASATTYRENSEKRSLTGAAKGDA